MLTHISLNYFHMILYIFSVFILCPHTLFICISHSPTEHHLVCVFRPPFDVWLLMCRYPFVPHYFSETDDSLMFIWLSMVSFLYKTFAVGITKSSSNYNTSHIETLTRFLISSLIIPTITDATAIT